MLARYHTGSELLRLENDLVIKVWLRSHLYNPYTFEFFCSNHKQTYSVYNPEWNIHPYLGVIQDGGNTTSNHVSLSKLKVSSKKLSQISSNYNLVNFFNVTLLICIFRLDLVPNPGSMFQRVKTFEKWLLDNGE